jgi:hypothetical protein
MGNPQNRKRKKKRIPPSKGSKKLKDGGQPSSQNMGASQTKLADSHGKFGENSGDSDSVKEGTIFMDVQVLFGVFDEVLRCPDCGKHITSHVDMKKK